MNFSHSKIPDTGFLGFTHGFFGASDEVFPPVPVNLLDMLRICVRFFLSLPSGVCEPPYEGFYLSIYE